jgi:hypothetical protein
LMQPPPNLPRCPARSHLRALAIACALGFAWLGDRAALAAPLPGPADAGVSCAAVEQRLADAQRTLQTCTRNADSAIEERAACTSDLSSTSDKLHQCQGRVDAAQRERDGLCAEASSFARELLKGRVTNVGTCVPGQAQTELAALLKGWDGASAALAQIAAFGAGEAETLPRALGSSPAELRVAKLYGVAEREPIFYRRLLTEAVKLTAPVAWQGIRAGGPAKVAAWFAATTPLETGLVEEAQREHASAPGPAGPPLTAALRLVLSYLTVAQCDAETPSHACGRAHQLQQLLESTGPLLVRRRVEDVWATECSDVAPETLLSWVQDFPHGAANPADLSDVAAAAHAKLFTCFLDAPDAEPSFRVWLDKRLPGPKALTAKTLRRIDDIRSRVKDDGPTDTCGRAVRAMQKVAMPATCVMPPPELAAPIERWAKLAPTVDDDGVSLAVCRQYARLLWEGRAATIERAFAHPPSVDEMVIIDERVPETSFARLRRVCDERHGTGDAFARNLSALGSIARGLGESPDGAPWRVDPDKGAPAEVARFARASTFRAWAGHLFSRQSSCSAMGLPDARCEECSELPADTFYDCDLKVSVERRWNERERATVAALGGAGALLFLLIWAVRLRRARRVFKEWALPTRIRLAALGLDAQPDPLRYVFPSRHDVLTIELPREPAWERWGSRASVVRVHDAAKVQESDVNHAVQISHRHGARVLFLLHEDAASLDLSAVRAVLDWAARGGTRQASVLPLAVSRLAWARRATDLLDLVEESSLRGNPFEVRGRITSSNQFWNRERLVSGLLADTRAGRWLVITGLRRFGKSSLALEVARRLPGPSAYVDLAGFHHEIGFLDNPSQAVDAVLRSLCARLAESARALYPQAVVEEPPTAEVDAAELTRWIRQLSVACTSFTAGRAPPILLVLDEVEQVLSVGPDRLGHVLDVLAILLGRLRNAVGDSPHPEGQSPVSILMCSALHELLWAPLRTLGQQSIMGAFPSICVPCLAPEAASAMMRGLGARQGIRFTDDALATVVRETQGVPLLLRRVGTSLLELYDAEHARQGSLGAVQIGIEGAREAVEREEREGSPLRVWVESEIAEPTSTTGVMLRRLARDGRVSVAALREMAEAHVVAQFESTGVTRHLSAEETRRRAQEAASVMLRLLAETGLLLPGGDLTAPDSYELLDGSIRRVLQAATESPSVRRAR